MGNLTVKKPKTDKVKTDDNNPLVLTISTDKKVVSYLVKRTSQDLKSSRCSAYNYLIP